MIIPITISKINCNTVINANSIFARTTMIIDIILLNNNCGTFFNKNCLYKLIGMYFIKIAFFPCLEIDVTEIFMKLDNICIMPKIIQTPSIVKCIPFNDSNISGFSGMTDILK